MYCRKEFGICLKHKLIQLTSTQAFRRCFKIIHSRMRGSAVKLSLLRAMATSRKYEATRPTYRARSFRTSSALRQNFQYLQYLLTRNNCKKLWLKHFKYESKRITDCLYCPAAYSTTLLLVHLMMLVVFDRTVGCVSRNPYI